MRAHQRSARRLAAAVTVILAGFAVSALADPARRPAPGPAAGAAALTASAAARTDDPAPAFRAAQARRTFSAPTTSSPIAMSRDGRLVWVVNPGADTVTVIRTSSNTPLRTIRVGDEPQSVALDPSNRFAF